MTSRPVLIAGAGIAGLTAAIALARAGVDVLLVEKRGGFSEAGAGLQLSPNATSVIIALGLGPAIARHAVAPRRLDIRRFGEPRAFAGMTMQDQPEVDGAPFWCLGRSDLQMALLDQARMMPGIRLMVGRSVAAITSSPDAVTVVLENGRGLREEVNVAALIGADGLWSSVRALSGDTILPRFLGYEAWRTLIPAANAENFVCAPHVNLWLGQAGHAVHYPVAGGKLINLVLIRRGQNQSQDWSRAGDAGELSAISAAAAATLRNLIDVAPAWQVWSLFDRPPARMANGRVALIGDAAHPVLPFLAQGAGLAIEDAGVLGRLLPPALADGKAGAVEAALKRFSGLRAARTARVQETARGNGRMYHAGFPVSIARDFALTQFGDAGMRKRYGWLYGWRMRD
ncbi:MAG: FAD-dependent monooxygenase [Bosea sp. (in: a-proteobacteria)]